MHSVYSQPWNIGLQQAIKSCSCVFILSDSNLPKHYIDELIEVCSLCAKVSTHSIPGCEQIKTITQAENLYQELHNSGVDRSSVMICLGGGTITDLGGFVASSFKRGIDLVLLPTTLLAMVDASIGGKNGVNLNSTHGNLKNQIGTFYLPKFIGLNTSWLESLPLRELRSGKSEMIKHALLFGDQKYLDQVLNTELSELESLIAKSAQIKQDIVDQDLFEKGSRAQLNLGHTIAHALEALASKNGEDLRHGEAVAWGLAFALKVSNKYLDIQDKIISGINISLPQSEEMWEAMGADKKNKNDNVTDVILTDSSPKVDFIWNQNEFIKMWEDFCKKYS